jgi:hypothetical protein
MSKMIPHQGDASIVSFKEPWSGLLCVVPSAAPHNAQCAGGISACASGSGDPTPVWHLTTFLAAVVSDLRLRVGVARVHRTRVPVDLRAAAAPLLLALNAYRASSMLPSPQPTALQCAVTPLQQSRQRSRTSTHFDGARVDAAAPPFVLVLHAIASLIPTTSPWSEETDVMQASTNNDLHQPTDKRTATTVSLIEMVTEYLHWCCLRQGSVSADAFWRTEDVLRLVSPSHSETCVAQHHHHAPAMCGVTTQTSMLHTCLYVWMPSGDGRGEESRCDASTGGAQQNTSVVFADDAAAVRQWLEDMTTAAVEGTSRRRPLPCDSNTFEVEESYVIKPKEKEDSSTHGIRLETCSTVCLLRLVRLGTLSLSHAIPILHKRFTNHLDENSGRSSGGLARSASGWRSLFDQLNNVHRIRHPQQGSPHGRNLAQPTRE